jgi:glycosyltransferase involved in cell wall biosynthesis
LGNILIVTHYYAPDGGAAASRLTPLAQFLRRRGHAVTVLTTLPHYPQGRIAPAYAGKWADVRDEDGVRVVRVWLWATPSPRLSRRLISQLSFMLSASLRGLSLPRPDVVFIEAQPIFTGLAGRFIAWLKRAPTVLNVSDLWPDHLLSVGALRETSPVYRLARWVVDTGYRQARHIVALSPAWARKIAEYAPQQRNISVILRGTDTAHFSPSADGNAFRARHALGDAPIVSFIGTFATQYDFSAQLAVAERLPDVCFLYVGTGSQRDLVHERAQRLPNVRLIDWVDSADMPAVWRASTLTYWAMRPSPLYEGTLPAKLYEALACGVPIVASQTGEAAELIAQSGAGVVVPTGDVDGLTQAIADLLANAPARQRMADAARAYAEAHLSFERTLATYAHLLEGVMRK